MLPSSFHAIGIIRARGRWQNFSYGMWAHERPRNFSYKEFVSLLLLRIPSKVCIVFERLDLKVSTTFSRSYMKVLSINYRETFVQWISLMKISTECVAWNVARSTLNRSKRCFEHLQTVLAECLMRIAWVGRYRRQMRAWISWSRQSRKCVTDYHRPIDDRQTERRDSAVQKYSLGNSSIAINIVLNRHLARNSFLVVLENRVSAQTNSGKCTLVGGRSISRACIRTFNRHAALCAHNRPWCCVLERRAQWKSPRLSVPIIFPVHLMSFSSCPAHNTIVKQNEIARAWMFFFFEKIQSLSSIRALNARRRIMILNIRAYNLGCKNI